MTQPGPVEVQVPHAGHRLARHASDPAWAAAAAAAAAAAQGTGSDLPTSAGPLVMFGLVSGAAGPTAGRMVTDGVVAGLQMTIQPAVDHAAAGYPSEDDHSACGCGGDRAQGDE